VTAVPEIVVTGRGVVSSIGEGAEPFFDALLAKKSGIADGIGACSDFDPESAMTPKDVRRSDRYTHLAVAAATPRRLLDVLELVGEDLLGVEQQAPDQGRLAVVDRPGGREAHQISGSESHQCFAL